MPHHVRLLLVLASLCLAGCYPPARVFVVSQDFTPEERAQVEEAVMVWAALCPALGLELAEEDAEHPANVHRNCTATEARGAKAFTTLSVDWQPDSFTLCPGNDDRNTLTQIALHELGHLIRQDESHADYAPSIMQEGGYLPLRPSPRDVENVCGATEPAPVSVGG